MCGIAGKLIFDRSASVERPSIDAMLGPIAHRGPDGQGVYLDGNVGLGHVRLSIIDLSTGDQPMANEDESVWIVFNGEIYNYLELRERLVKKGHQFRSRSDTEVIIHLYEELGPECVRELRGMFAFAIWDAPRRRLFLARDRVGIKPLYYCQTREALYFASELKSIIADPAIPREVHLPALSKFLCFNYVPGEETPLRGILKLLPGHHLVAEQGKLITREYWDLRFTDDRAHVPYETATEELNALVRGAVRDHMIADVPVGILLSGGVDSTAVLSCATPETGRKIKTFTVGFDGEEFDDERPYARIAAERYGTDHHEISISPQEFSSFLPSYVWHMEEPVCEAPAIALYYVSKLARQHVKVLLSGEGGDEAFGGYTTYRNLLWLEQAKRLAGPFKGLLAGCLNRAGGRFGKYGPLIAPALSDYYYSRTASPFSYFNRHRQTLCSPEFLAGAAAGSPVDYIQQLFRRVAGRPLLDQMLYIDTKTWLPDDLLIKADKITMANSLELRVPLLDHLVLEYAASLPPAYKVRGAATKRIFKDAFTREIPEAIRTRRKTGFPVPLRRWLGHDLRDFARDALFSGKAAGRGYFQKAGLEKALGPDRGHGASNRNGNGNGTSDGASAAEIFSLLTLELWHREFIDANSSKTAVPAA